MEFSTFRDFVRSLGCHVKRNVRRIWFTRLPGYTRGYYWAIPAHVYTRGCLRARGFNSSGTATWYNVGCGTSGGSHVPWGNVLATPAAQAKSMAPPAGTTINWDE